MAVLACWIQTGCKPKTTSIGDDRKTIQATGSDVMVNLLLSRSQTYHQVNPKWQLEVTGGGTSNGIAALLLGTADIANVSRDLTASEVEWAQKATGKKPRRFIVDCDAVEVFVHPDNPLNEITVEQLAQIYAQDGTLTNWSQLGITVPECETNVISRVGREPDSSTAEFLREFVFPSQQFKADAVELPSSEDVVELVAHSPCAIGYGGLGYATKVVKVLKVAASKNAPAVRPSVANIVAEKYPIARLLSCYTLGEPRRRHKAIPGVVSGQNPFYQRQPNERRTSPTFARELTVFSVAYCAVDWMECTLD